MNQTTHPFHAERRRQLLALAAGAAAGLPWAALAQLSSPLGAASNAKPAASAPPAIGAAPNSGFDFSGRTGPGQHSPLSPFQPLPERADVLAWTMLTNVKTRVEKKKVLPVFPESVAAISGRTQRVQGFMLPLEPGERQRHFLLSQVPLSCSFCTPGGPESIIEVRTKTPVKYGFEVVVVEGKFQALPDDPYGIYYRVSDAVQVR